MLLLLYLYVLSLRSFLAAPCIAHCREMERREKVDEARRATERILAQQEAEVKARKVRGVQGR